MEFHRDSYRVRDRELLVKKVVLVQIVAEIEAFVWDWNWGRWVVKVASSLAK